MSLIEIVYRILAQEYSPSVYGGAGILVAMLASIILSVYIYLCYRMAARRTMYSLRFNLSLLISGPVTCALILMMHQHAIASVGVVGTLAVVRLRGAVKEPMDLVFELWSIACGIFIAAGMWRIGIVVSIFMTAVVFVTGFFLPGQTPLILAIYGHEGEEPDLERICRKTIEAACGYRKLISTGKVDGRRNLVLHVRTKQRIRLTNELARLPEVDGVTLLEQAGEVT